MDELFEKLKEYLSMDKEIPFTEFSEYFEKVLKVIGDEYKEYKQEQLEKARFIFSILQSNAVERGSRKDKNTKKLLSDVVPDSNFFVQHIRIAGENEALFSI